ncbi:MAG: ABC transporter permease [Kineosporiaceae bacterium]
MAVATVGSGRAPGKGRDADGPPAARSRAAWLLLTPGLAWLVLFFATPLFFLFGTSLQTRVPDGDIGEFEQTFSWSNYGEALRTYWPQFLRSFEYAAIATVLALAIAYPMAYFIAHKAGRMRNVLLVLVVAPFFASFILRTIAWRQILGEDSILVRAMHAVHLIPDGFAVTNSPLAVVAGITYNFLPFMTLPLYSSLERIDPRLIEAGGDLYASPFTTFRKVTFPLSMPGVVAGTLLTFIPAAGDYVNADLLGRPPATTMIGNVVQSRFFKIVDYPTAAVLSFLLMAAILVLVLLYVRKAGTEELL